MPYLGDYLGQLLSEISMARMQADLETVRLAELYAAHPLLRTMPVPHMRLPDVELDFPVLIKTSEDPRAGESARGGWTPVIFRAKYDEVLLAWMKKHRLLLPRADLKKLNKALDDITAQSGVPTETSIDVQWIVDQYMATTTAIIINKFKTQKSYDFSQIAAELREASRIEFLKLRTPPPRLTVLVTTAEIQEAGNAENLTRLHLKVSEAGMEWTMIESEGVQRDRLGAKGIEIDKELSM